MQEMRSILFYATGLRFLRTRTNTENVHLVIQSSCIRQTKTNVNIENHTLVFNKDHANWPSKVKTVFQPLH